MRATKYIIGALLGIFLLAGITEAQKLSISQPASGVVYIDTVWWRSGTTPSKVCTLIAAAAASKDTSTQWINMTGLESLWLMIKRDNRQGTAAGTAAFSCTLKVSPDTTNLFPVGPVFSHAASADTTHIVFYLSPYWVSGDTSITGGARAAEIAASPGWGRFVLSMAEGAADSNLVIGILGRKYRSD